MTTLLDSIYDHRSSTSWAASLRDQRLNFFKSLVATVPLPLKILDVGGTDQFWRRIELLDHAEVEITIINADVAELGIAHPRLRSSVGDARNMPQFSSQSFDIVFSNSVIEHVGSYADQQAMANEVRRIGKRYFIQTPNRYFPIEPHFVFPGFQFLPTEVRVWLATHFKLGWYDRFTDVDLARQAISEIRLLSQREVVQLFPGGKLYKEKVFGLTKSHILYGGW